MKKMEKSTIIIAAATSVIVIGIVSLLISRRVKRNKEFVNEISVEPNVFEKIALQFSDKISSELEAAERKIRSVVSGKEITAQQLADKELGLYF
jgi:hypothetical protein